MNQRICVFISVLILTGCAHDYLATGLPMLKGQPVSQALGYLGPPTQKVHVGEEMPYTWINAQNGSFNVPDTAPYPVVVQNGGHPSVAFTQPPMSAATNTYDWYCRLDITARKGVIVHTAYNGNAGGCRMFSNKLKPLVGVN